MTHISLLETEIDKLLKEFSLQEVIDVAERLRKSNNAKKELTIICNRGNWDVVYLIPHGHVVVSMQIKLLCYRVLGIETIDWFYTSQLGYYPMQFGLRELLLQRREHSIK